MGIQRRCRVNVPLLRSFNIINLCPTTELNIVRTTGTGVGDLAMHRPRNEATKSIKGSYLLVKAFSNQQSIRNISRQPKK